jgi:hypothetical protein
METLKPVNDTDSMSQENESANITVYWWHVRFLPKNYISRTSKIWENNNEKKQKKREQRTQGSHIKPTHSQTPGRLPDFMNHDWLQKTMVWGMDAKSVRDDKRKLVTDVASPKWSSVKLDIWVATLEYRMLDIQQWHLSGINEREVVER